MIIIRELRIGNIAKVENLTGCVTDIITNDEELYFDFSPNYEYPPWLVNPIPITGDFLVKHLGFEHGHKEWWENYRLPNNYFVSICLKEDNYYKIGDIICGPSETQLSYIHQLQNLYFFTCGCKSELIYTP